MSIGGPHEVLPSHGRRISLSHCPNGGPRIANDVFPAGELPEE